MANPGEVGVRLVYKEYPLPAHVQAQGHQGAVAPFVGEDVAEEVGVGFLVVQRGRRATGRELHGEVGRSTG